MTPKQFASAIGSNAWNWSLHDFAAKVNGDPEHGWVQEKFRNFQELATLLGKFDERLLDVICGRDDGPAATHSR